MTLRAGHPGEACRDGVTGCRCCALPYVEANGYCELCNNRGHNKEDINMCDRPQLGLATTDDLLREIRTRIEMDYYTGGGGLDYTTVHGRPPLNVQDPATTPSSPPDRTQLDD